MSTAEIEVVEAFTSIGVAPDKAMAAAAALNKRDAVADVRGIRSELAVLKSEQAVLKRMVGFNLTLTVAIIIKLFSH